MKKYIIICTSAILLLFIFITGQSKAFFSHSAEIENKIVVGFNDNKIVENFDEVEDWQPNTTYTKEVQVTNTGNVDCYVRALVVASDDTYVKQLNFDFTNWTKNGDYYYYNLILEPNQSTTQLLKSVTTKSTTEKEPFDVYVYVETVQCEGYSSAIDAFSKIK